MFTRLLAQLDLIEKKYFNEYMLLDDKLIIKTPKAYDDTTLAAEIIEIMGKIVKNVFDFDYTEGKIVITLKPVYAHISDDVKSKVSGIRFVFPSQYCRSFIEEAQKYGIEVTTDEIMTNELIEDRVVNQTVRLNHYADNAISAMQQRDESQLEQVIEDTKELRHEIEDLRYKLYEDPLTQVLNRRWLDDSYLDIERTFFKKSGILVLVDVDKFKEINDNYGHATGDKVLIYIANQLKKSGGEVIRFGGDEFFIMFDETVPLKKIRQEYQQIQKKMEKKELKSEGNRFHIRFSFGAVRFSENDKFIHIVGEADAEMFDDKKKG